MQGSFDVSAARLYYDSHGLPAPVGSEEPLFNFASTALSSPKEAKVPPMKKVSPMDGKMEKAKRVLKEAEERFKENSSPENEDLMYRAQMLYSEVEVKYAEEQDRLQEELQYSENYDAYDFTRCVRPDGSVYGTRGKCRKGAEASESQLPEPPGAKASTKRPSKGSTNRAAEILEELDRLPKGDSPKKEKLLEEYFRLYGTAPAPAKKISDPVPKILEAQRRNKQFNDEENKRITALAEAGKIKGVDPGAVQRIRARKIMDRINQESDPVKQRQLIRQLEEINNPLVKLPDGRVARSWEPKSPYEM